MTRKEFIEQVGKSAAVLLLPVCISGLSACKKKNEKKEEASKKDFTLDVSSGPLASNGGALVHDGVIVARTLSGNFIAVDAACTHQGTTINYVSSSNSFLCPNHGSKFDSGGNVTQGPATTSLRSYNTTLSGNSLRVFEA
jgi:cytochrome b6-f complex iron-sulfur subunit